MQNHLNAGTITAFLTTALGLLVMLVPRLAPYQDKLASTLAAGIVLIFGAIQLVDEIAANFKAKPPAK